MFRGMQSGRRVGAALVTIAAAAASAPAVEAAVPGHNGRIAFVSDRIDFNTEIFTAEADGSDVRQITSGGHYVYDPVWSPDGTKIAFTKNDGESGTDVWVMNADGSDQRNVSQDPVGAHEPAWSPDGSKIAFATGRNARPGTGQGDVYVMDADGSNQRRLTVNDAANYEPAWSPDGTKITFTSNRHPQYPRQFENEIWVINADGTGEQRLTFDGQNYESSWSPDGSRIAFISNRDYSTEEDQTRVFHYEIYTMNPDGSDQHPVTSLDDNITGDSDPAWSPDGTQLVFQSYPDDTGWSTLFTMPATGGARTDIANTPEAGEEVPDWGYGTPPPAGEPGDGFRCRASAIRTTLSVLALEPVASNRPASPCRTDSDEMLSLPTGLPLGLGARVLGTDTAAADQGGQAEAAVASVALTSGTTTIKATGLQATASAGCQGLESSSAVASLTVNGKPARAGDQPQTIPAGLVTIRLNHLTRSAGEVVRRALWITTPLGDVIAGEALAGRSADCG